MHTFQINVLIQFLASSTYFENQVFITRKTICTCISSTSFYLLDCLHKCTKNISYKTACTNGLPDDEHAMFETSKSLQELN